MRLLSVVVSGLFSLALLGDVAQAQAPRHVYLTWRGDPATTLTVNAQTLEGDPGLAVRYDTEPRGGDPEAYRYRAAGTAHQVEGLPDGRSVHWIDLTDLTPDGPVYFVVGSDARGFSAEVAARTLPDDDRPVRFAAGGDLGVGDEMRRLLRAAAARDARFALVGGDIAYVNGDLGRVETWDVWLDAWQADMVTPDGFAIPMVLAVGNHEVRGGYLGGPERTPFYLGFFAQPGNPSYFRFPIGTNAVVYVLDTGHVVPHETQTEWLSERMAADRDVPFRFATYHIPLYPSHRPYDGRSSELGRAHWGPVFDRHRLTAAFENHDHTLKRSKPLRAGAVDPEGTLYFGDGAWGRGDRTVDLSPRWYLDKAGANRHVWLVDVAADGVVYRAVDVDGHEIDVYPTDAPGAEAAEARFQTLPQLWALGEGALAVEPLASLAGPFEAAAVAAEVRNTEAYPVRVTVSFEADAPLAVAPAHATLALAPGEAAPLAFRLLADAPVGDGLFPRAVLRAAYTFDRGTAAPVTVELEQRVAAERVMVAERRTAPVRLDGALDDWGPLPYRIERTAHPDASTSQWGGPEDASFRFAVAVDADTLYLAVRVDDDRVVPGGPQTVWDAARDAMGQDGLLLWLDPHPGGDGDDDPYLAVGPGREAGEAPLVAADTDRRDLAAVAQAAAQTDAGGYTLELAVPLAALVAEGAGPLAAVRLNLALSDVDEPGGAPDVLFWRPQWESADDVEGFGVVALPGLDPTERP